MEESLIAMDDCSDSLSREQSIEEQIKVYEDCKQHVKQHKSDLSRIQELGRRVAAEGQ